MVRLLFVRHAPTPETGKRLTGRLPGVSLGDAGLGIARRLGERLAPVRVAAVYASPLERTWETAEAVAAPHGLHPTPHDGLIEVDFGRWAGRTLASLSRLKAWTTVQLAPSRFRFPDGESPVEVQARAVAACEEIAARHKRGAVVLVSHADVIKTVVSHYLGQPLDLFQRIGVAPASVSVLDLPSSGPARLVALSTSGDPTSW